MIPVDAWQWRPAEEANLFNPAFVGSIIYEFVREFQRGKPDGAPLTYLPIALTISLHRPMRNRLPYSTITPLYAWVQDNEDLLIRFHERVMGLLPYIREAIGFSMQQQTIQFGKGHLIQIGEANAYFPASFLRDTTTEVSDVIKRSQFVARWFLKSGSEASILACWGLRP